MGRHLGQVPEILAAVARSPGYVIHSINHTDVRQALEEGCSRLGVPCHFALEPLIGRLAEYSGARVQSSTSSRDPFDEDYYRRIEAMKFTLAHDDGIASDDLDSADVIVVGVSRATKTPTCMYLASRGIKAANVPLVPGIPPPAAVLRARSTLVVGLTIDPGHLSRARRQRLTTSRAARRRKHQLCRHRSAAPRGARCAAAVHPLRLADNRRYRRFYRAYRSNDHRVAQGARRDAEIGRAPRDGRAVT